MEADKRGASHNDVQLKLLTEPFGYDTGTGISLRAREFNRYELVTVLREFSCYEPAIKKILDCLTHSGRYDCTVQRDWVRRVDVREALQRCGVRMSVTHDKGIPL